MKKIFITTAIFLSGVAICGAQEDVKKQAEEQMKMMQHEAPVHPEPPQHPEEPTHPEPPLADPNSPQDPHMHGDPNMPAHGEPHKELSEADRAEFEKAMVKLHEGRHKLQLAREILHQKLDKGEITEEKFMEVLKDLDKADMEFDKTHDELVRKLH